MPTPAKPCSVLEAEGKSHRTKAELEKRREGEAALATGKKLKERSEVQSNPIAHKEFLRLNKLLETIGKNDAIYEAVINRYCLLHAECSDFEKKRESFYHSIEELETDKERLLEAGEMSLQAYFKMKNNLQNTIISLDKQVQAKRKMMFDIERENIMTIAAALRSIPKKAEPEENILAKVLMEWVCRKTEAINMQNGV